MKMIKLTLITVAVLLTAAASVFADSIPSTYIVPKGKQLLDKALMPGYSLFNSQELSFDIGPTYTLPASTTIFQKGGSKGVWGGDFAATYWIKRYFGLGLDTGIINTKQRNDLVFSHADITFDARLPLDFVSASVPFKNVALTGAGMIGKDFSNGAYETTLEAGAEFRFTPMLGFGGEYRRTFEVGPNNDKGEIVTYLSFSF